MSQQIANEIESIMQQDPGRRGVARWACHSQLLPATQSLLNGGRVLITTGFYILSAGVIETDGPPGAIVLADALVKLGRPVSILVDTHAASIMKSGLECVESDIALIETTPTASSLPPEMLHRDTTHFVAIERPGRSENGCYYNFAGKDISAFVSPVDDLFVHAKKNGIITIGIGDGGNELGMDQVSAKVDEHLACSPPISCRVGADYCICAGVSNWGGYGMAALLSRLAGKNLLLPVDRLVGLLDRIVAAGAVDGILAKPCATVDGLDASWERDIYSRMLQIAQAG